MKYFTLFTLFTVVLLIVVYSPQLPCLPQKPKENPCKGNSCPNQRPSLWGKTPMSY
uniref:3.9 kDa salivary protein n=1 Tax=Phlebotomus orientalis TaxID=99786 RepID=V5K6A1_PHLOR|nr:3.9 kDa salivary protein [Phlebotomus orientalis]